ncbi:peptide ABC transporter ATP-binding protein [Pseudonocardia sp. EC080610-09]|uniref:ABC transporter ATP-binding protein n=1 Tax=unclassified Pseudonocardia TaxID=2619320 RepID=UPI0006CB6729|nr:MULTISPECIES: ABC transporter ATP-binding protein [unclassified Pseudonocardia]ALE72212.1 peptide ABC transporter ATP-binding protein [Pseudonocardia sp. EC080625-04]ALL75497.1 peptide ABC transporter ATP-binding protein [Pseudonocardia sp. EC080610-09]ALL82523.1 peptide ABC transporter ATP-binding protein [Pseudonocardia sp. EC080619-01]
MSARGTDVLTVRDLDVAFRVGRGPRARTVRAVTGAGLTLRGGRLTALVGESGCGKSVLAEALTGLLPGTASVRGSAVLSTPDGAGTVELLTAPEAVLRDRVRGRLIGLVPQSAASHLTPTRTVGAQLRETVARLGTDTTAAELLDRAALPAHVLGLYPHELSGGQAQRAGLASALAGNPPVLLADEPTAGLDRPLVEHVTALLAGLADEGHAVLLITHDLRAARDVADDIAVMYASRLVETGPADDVVAEPWHPYTAGLLGALPGAGFTPVPGHPPELSALPDGCPFAPRCAVSASCSGDPEPVSYGDRRVSCHVPEGAR